MKNLVRAIRYLGHYRRIALVAYLALIISTASQLMVPQLVQNIIDAVTNGLIAQRVAQAPAAFKGPALQALGWSAEQFQRYSTGAESAIIWAGLLILAFAVARGFFAFAQGYMAERASQSVAFDFRNELYAKIQRLSFSYHDRNQTGQLMIRATDDVEKVRQFIGQGLLLAVQALIILTGALVILMFTNFRLMLTILPVLPVALIIFMAFGAITQPMFVKVQQKLSALNTILQENLAGIKVVKAFAREPEQIARFDRSAEDLMRQQITVSRAFSFVFPLVFLIANLGQAAVLYFGGQQIIGGTLTFGQWQKFSLYLVFVFFPLGQLGLIISQMAQASASANRIFEILDTRSDVANRPGAIALPQIRGRVAFENVTFRYFGGGEPVLQDVSFAAEPGQTVALLGATGSGKSTIINLIPRFYDVTAGRVTVDGYDVRDVTLESLRSQIGIVLQETTLFSGTIRDNIAFGRPDASMEEIIAAAKAAAAHDFIMSFPQGYDTRVGERGTTLSGGQKQRIAIARAILLDPRILILDDSTSSVDTVTEYQIQQALDRLMAGRTSFVIAQRISTVRRADQILVLEKGRIVARGTHEELLEDSPLYAEIFASQLVEDAKEG
ncbi:MAG: ABC transporter ATP-binding protein/permease [Anaerolineae bacterium]|nr:ABC transporter ATP-binding protein/permease [Anaerolineae bacterium]